MQLLQGRWAKPTRSIDGHIRGLCRYGERAKGLLSQTVVSLRVPRIASADWTIILTCKPCFNAASVEIMPAGSPYTHGFFGLFDIAQHLVPASLFQVIETNRACGFISQSGNNSLRCRQVWKRAPNCFARLSKQLGITCVPIL